MTGSLTRTDLLETRLAGTPPIERTRMTRIELGPGAETGAHRHPCDVVGVVLEGEIRFAIDGGEVRMLHAGDAFAEPRGVLVRHFDNASASEPAVFVACYLMSPDVDEVIVMEPDGAPSSGS